MWHKDTVRFPTLGIEVPGRKDRIVSDHTRPDLNLASKRQGWSTLNDGPNVKKTGLTNNSVNYRVFVPTC